MNRRMLILGGLVTTALLISGAANIMLLRADNEKPAVVEYEYESFDKPPFGVSFFGPDGGMLETSVNDLKAKLEAPKGQSVRVLDLFSTGGTEEDAQRLVETIRLFQPQVVVRVTAGHVCGSACVLVFNNTKHDSPDPKSFWFFHQGSAQPTLLAKLGVLRPDMDNHHKMDAWADELAPGLTAFLHTCVPDPLQTSDGIVLRWSEIEAIVAGRRRACEDLSGHTWKWFIKSLPYPSN